MREDTGETSHHRILLEYLLPVIMHKPLSKQWDNHIQGQDRSFKQAIKFPPSTKRVQGLREREEYQAGGGGGKPLKDISGLK